MKRIALVGDTHADEHSRLAEHDRIMAWIGTDAAERGVDLYMHSGDVWERKSTGRERLSVADWARAWTEHGPLVVVAGNHCDPLDIEWLGRLRTRHQVHAITRPEVVHVAGCAIACLPWPRKAHLLAQLGNVSREEGDQAAVQALRNILLGLGEGLDSYDGPRLFLGHVQMRGSRISVSQPPLTGCDFELGLTDLAMVRAAFYGLGHIHLGAGNEWDIAGAPAAYPGSPRRCNYGEVEAKSYIIVDFDGTKLVGWERVETPCIGMIHLDGKWHDGELLGIEHPDVRGAEVRLRWQTPSEHREAARAKALEWRDRITTAGALSVKLEEQITTETRARTPEVAAAKTLPEKLERLWESRGNVPTPERRESLLIKVSQLEESAA